MKAVMYRSSTTPRKSAATVTCFSVLLTNALLVSLFGQYPSKALEIPWTKGLRDLCTAMIYSLHLASNTPAAPAGSRVKHVLPAPKVWLKHLQPHLQAFAIILQRNQLK